MSNGDLFSTTMAEIDFMRQYGVRIAINWATQIGATIILLLVLLLLTRREKRSSSIFIMNAFCLVLNAIRSILQSVWLTTPFYHPYAIVASDFSRVTNADRAITVASNTIMLMLVIGIMVSLSLQVWVVCITAKPLQKLVIMGVTSLVALVAIGYRFAVTVVSNKQTMKDANMTPYSSLVTDMNISFAVAVWIYCLIFTFKLGYALLQRKRLRMTQFGPMQIIFIMGCQTMVVPGKRLRHFTYRSHINSSQLSSQASTSTTESPSLLHKAPQSSASFYPCPLSGLALSLATPVSAARDPMHTSGSSKTSSTDRHLPAPTHTLIGVT